MAAVRAGDFERADREIDLTLAAMPAGLQLAVDLVPLLDQAGRQAQADRLFDRVSGRCRTNYSTIRTAPCCTTNWPRSPPAAIAGWRKRYRTPSGPSNSSQTTPPIRTPWRRPRTSFRTDKRTRPGL